MFDTLEKRIAAIEARNVRVEADKAWEVSLTRKILIALLTYFLLALVMWVIGIENPALSALIPTGGFLLSTLSFAAVKRLWLARVFAPANQTDKPAQP